VQLGVPVDNLHDLIFQRWAALWGIFAVVTGLAVTATLLISRTIIQPLSALRESALRLSQGDFSHRVAYTGSDEIAEVARAFNDMAHQVESLLEEQRAFASNTSHELRTPLTTIRLRSEALRYDDKLDEESARQYIREIDDEVSRLGSLIEDLTLLSRFDAGRAELGNNQIDLGRFAFGLQQQTLDQASARNIQLELDTPAEMPPVCAGLNHLTVVFRNLLDNAIKYTPDGGQVSWRLWTDDTGIYSALQDNGTGIAPEHLPHLFERFFRVDKARSRDVPGTGLGLALVKSILDAYGGTISIKSDGIGRGTCVTVHWPYHPVERRV
jgi:histidine kinase